MSQGHYSLTINTIPLVTHMSNYSIESMVIVIWMRFRYQLVTSNQYVFQISSTSKLGIGTSNI